MALSFLPDIINALQNLKTNVVAEAEALA